MKLLIMQHKKPGTSWWFDIGISWHNNYFFEFRSTFAIALGLFSIVLRYGKK